MTLQYISLISCIDVKHSFENGCSEICERYLQCAKFMCHYCFFLRLSSQCIIALYGVDFEKKKTTKCWSADETLITYFSSQSGQAIESVLSAFSPFTVVVRCLMLSAGRLTAMTEGRRRFRSLNFAFI